MATKNFDARVQLKNDIEANWIKAVNFIPLKGELIIYNPSPDDVNYPSIEYRFKIGDGLTKINDLDFAILNPVRGIDYWTDADKAEIKSYVDDAILNGEW